MDRLRYGSRRQRSVPRTPDAAYQDQIAILKAGDMPKQDSIRRVFKDFVICFVVMPLIILLVGTLFNLFMWSIGGIDRVHFRMGQCITLYLVALICPVYFLYRFIGKPLFNK